jgi:hypothetical protein
MTAADLIAKYGPPNKAYLEANCILWYIQEDFPWFPAKVVFINKDFKDMLFVSFTAVWAAGLQVEIKTYNGCYVNRPVRGSNSISAHAYAAAMDLDAAIDGMVVNPTQDQRLGKWSQAFVDAMTSSGVFFGGNFIHRADPMHFSMADM